MNSAETSPRTKAHSNLSERHSKTPLDDTGSGGGPRRLDAGYACHAAADRRSTSTSPDL